MSPLASEEDAWTSVRSHSPYARLQGATWFLENSSAGSSTDLAKLLQQESVPAVRLILSRALRSRQATRDIGEDRHEGAATARESRAIGAGQDVASMIKHELGPTIGWLKSALREEVNDFESSRSMASVRRLQGRIDGLVALVKLDEDLQLQLIDLEVLLRESWPGEPNEMKMHHPSARVLISADQDLMITIVANAFQNAIDAQPGRKPSVEVSIGAEGGSFWMRIANDFDGLSFDFSSGYGEGLSTKGQQRGRGSRFMQLAARRMGFNLRVRGDSGVAMLLLTGGL